MKKIKKIPIKKYKYVNDWDGKIKKVRIIRETEHSVFFPSGSNARKHSSDTVYTDTPEEVFAWVVQKRKGEMEAKKRQYLHHKERYDNLVKEGMVCK